MVRPVVGKSFRFWQQWRELAGYIGDFQARLLLTVFYFSVGVPFGLLARFVIDPLCMRRRRDASAWTRRAIPAVHMSAARRQF